MTEPLPHHDDSKILTAGDVHNCIKLCWDTRHHVQTTLSEYCLKKGGAHASGSHVELMTDVVEICQVAADFMTRSSPMHTATCSAAAVICDACAESCEAFTKDREMLHCAEILRACAQACRTTGQEVLPPANKATESFNDTISA